MSQTADLFMGPDSHVSEPRTRLAAFLSRKFPPRDGYSAKRLSSAIRCTPKTAENILGGHWPNSHHWQRIAQIFGQDVLDAVFGPDINETVARLRKEERALEEQLEIARARRLQVEGVSSRPEQRLEAAPAETAALNDTSEVRAFTPRHQRN